MQRRALMYSALPIKRRNVAMVCFHGCLLIVRSFMVVVCMMEVRFMRLQVYFHCSSDFALKNAECTVIPEVESVLKKFHSLKKPIGLCCIAPVLAARCLPGVELTMGGDIDQNGRWPFAEASAVAKQMGAKMIPKDMTASFLSTSFIYANYLRMLFSWFDEIHVDEANKIVTTPAFMCGVTTLADVFDGIGKLVEAAIRI
ncbi:uncharacterized protein DEA37_0005688 [Paragonimus westermani]|uniref:DJ-1/PfpI domain-containing protein n=1 Tax=Paragonimus westermani TaxID=34504 RepID=A0A5J4NQB1_9TREM|nr:uncharacterized protein DEA37_0005688 [Paragonimus westermani]